MKQFACVALLAAWAGCTSPNPTSCLEDHHCSDPARPFCDEDGAIGGEAGTCIAVQCTANEFAECREDNALVCNATGDSLDLVDCPYGCGANGCLPCNTSECEKHIIPKYLPTACDSTSLLPALAFTADTNLDTSDASMCTSVASQMNGPEICIVRAPTITITAQKTLKVVGTRALALVADRELLVDGVLDASADLRPDPPNANGPGGGLVKSGIGSAVGGPGGGGAGARTAGGAGASDAGDGAAANGGAVGMSPAAVVSLVGGTQPAVTSGQRAPGGAGGAVTLVSCRAQVTVGGIVDVGGGGGYGDRLQSVGAQIFHDPAAGGGSGGTLVLQGMAVSVTGGAFANGGGGGGGGALFGVHNGNTGSDAVRATTPAPGGVPTDNNGGMGGHGGALENPAPGSRQSSAGCGTGCGAGGGSAGFILTLTAAGSAPAVATATVSPAFEPNVTIPTN